MMMFLTSALLKYEDKKMMISPQSYINDLKGKSYNRLIRERNSLMSYIRKYEKYLKTGKMSKGLDFNMEPQPEVIYQMYLEYLAELCPLIVSIYNKEQEAKKVIDEIAGGGAFLMVE